MTDQGDQSESKKEKLYLRTNLYTREHKSEYEKKREPPENKND